MNVLIRASLWAGASVLTANTASADALQEEVVLTGVRQAYRGDFSLTETPQTISVLDAELLSENNIQRLGDALDLISAVARQNNFGGLWDAYAVRGFSGDENLPSGYLVNGFNGGRGFGGPRDVSGVERIEVLKGPNAALFGRGEPGGTVNIVTKRAKFDETMSTLSASLGSFARQRADADVNVALGSALAVRFIGFHEQSDSFRDTLEQKRSGFTPSLSLRLGDATTLTYDLEWTRQELPFDRGVVAINNQLGVIPRERFLGEPGDGPLQADVTGHQLQMQHDFNADWSVLLGAAYRDTSLEGFSTEAELAAARQRLYVDGQSLSRQRRYRNYDAEHTVVRAEVSGDLDIAGLRNRVLFGADHDRFEYDQFFQRFRPATNASNPTEQQANIINIFTPVYGRFALPAVATFTSRLDEQKANGFYFQDQITLTARLQMRVGVRHDRFELANLNRLSSVSQSRTFSRTSPQAGLVFTVTPALSLFAAYGEGFRSNIGTTATGQFFDPEVSKSFETGARFGLFDKALTGTVALFSLRKSNVLAADPLNPGFSLPIGKAGSEGVELDLEGRLPGGFNVLVSYSYVDAQARADVLDPSFSLQIHAGDPLINIPKHSMNAQLSRQFMVIGKALNVGAGVQHVSKRLGETGTQFTLPAYTLARVFASWTVNEHVQIHADVKNLFDETWYANSFAALWVAPGAPRTASLGARVSF